MLWCIQMKKCLSLCYIAFVFLSDLFILRDFFLWNNSGRCCCVFFPCLVMFVVLVF